MLNYIYYIFDIRSMPRFVVCNPSTTQLLTTTCLQTLGLRAAWEPGGTWGGKMRVCQTNLTWLVVEPTHLKNIVVKLGPSSPNRGEIEKKHKNKTTT